MQTKTAENETVWSPTQVQFLYRHKNGRYYVRTYAGGKGNWTSLRTKLLSVAKNRMKEHVEAVERHRTTGNSVEAVGKLTFGEAIHSYRQQLAASDVRPNTKAYRESGLKLVLRSWEGVEALNVRRITSKTVEEWLRRFKAAAVPFVPPNAKSAAKNSTGASITTIKCALDAVRQVLDVAVSAGHLYANPARNTTVAESARRMFKATRRERAERAPLRLPTREEFIQLVEKIFTAGVADCKAAADYVQFIAFCGARKNEAAHVVWSDIDFTRETIHLRVTKNGESRFVPMTEEMKLLLERMKSDRQQATPDSRVLLLKEAQGFITSACRKLGIQRFTTHALRHLFGTACLEAGVDVRTVAGWLGHKDIFPKHSLGRFRSPLGSRPVASGLSTFAPRMDSLPLTKTTQPKPERDWYKNNMALVKLSADGETFLPENFWSLNDAFQGVQILGGTGSGKSSGSGQALARAFLDANLGGLVLTAKTDEVFAWKKYAKAAGRLDDLLIVDGAAKHCFNFLSYELHRPGAGAGHTENLVNLFCSVLEASERRHGQGSGGDAYWQRTLKQLLRNAIDLAVIAADDLDLPSLYRIITSAPRTPAEAADTAWQQKSVCYRLMEVAEGKAKEKDREADFDLTRDYWLREFPSLAEETRSVIVSTFTSMADCFLRGMLRKLFCTRLDFTPEDTFDGKIIILNLPVKEHNELGQFAQVLFKYVWQRAVERRIPPLITPEDAEETIRPVFLWADESQFFANSYDALFQSTARASRACTVYLTQNLPSYFAAFGGANSRSEVEAFIGNLQTKIFHANGDPTTNNWAAESIGKTRQMRYTGGTSEQLVRTQGNTGLNQSASGTQVVEFLVQSQEFTMLRTGGEECDMQVDGIIFQGGRRWVLPGKEPRKVQNFIRHVFPQIYG